MCTHARMPSGSRRNDRASSKSFAVSGSIVYVSSSRRSTRFETSIGRNSCCSNGCRSPRSTSSASSTFSTSSARPRFCSTCARPRPVRTTARSPRSRSPAPFRSRVIGTPGVKYGSPIEQLAAAADLDDERGSARSDLEEAADRQARADRAEAEAHRDQDQRGQREARAPSRRHRPRGAARSPAARSPCRARGR